MRYLSWILSVCIHLAVVGLALYMPSIEPTRIRLDLPVYQVNLVQLKGAPGPVKAKKPAPSPTVKKPEAKAPKKAEPAKQPPKPEPAKKAEPLVQKVQKPEPPKPKPEAPKPAPKPEPKPEPAPAKQDISPKKVEKPEPKKPEPKKETPKKAPKKAPEKEAPKKADKAAKPKPKPKKPKKAEPTPEQVLAQALKAAQTDAKKAEEKERQSVAQELAALQQMVEVENSLAQNATEDAGVGEGGQGGTDDYAGVDLASVYVLLVKQIIQQNWRFPNVAGREHLLSQVHIQLDIEGTILNYTLLKGSGRMDFDSSVLRALAETGELPPPPKPEFMELTINFNLQDLAQ